MKMEMALSMAVLNTASVQRRQKHPLETQHQKGPQLGPLTPLQMAGFELTEGQTAVGTSWV